MNSLMAKRFVVPAAMAAALGLSVPHASAQGFLDMLFGGGHGRHEPLRGKFPPPPKKRKAVPIQRISSPIYNTYKADRLVPVDFSGLIDPSITGSTTQDVAFEPPAAGSG